ncbi:MAG TPA: 4Fe-4S dicluster domain-containing protein [Crenalkalicoccus sp.]|nr:4Fe-4S dicluster domain-containing protein [Crenalkalicoccus sp.]
MSDPVLLRRREAALALLAGGLGLSACGKPAEQILPYVEMPERVVAGVPLRFATCLPLAGEGRGALVTTFEGRPVKIEGNPRHPASLGATDLFMQADIFQLYSPDRSRAPLERGNIAPWDDFTAALLPRLESLRPAQGEGLAIVTGHLTSPTELRLLAAVRRRFPRMAWHVHEPLQDANAEAGARAAFGQALRALPRLEQARVVLALDADPLGPGPQQVMLGHGFAERRMARAEGGAFLRLYAAGSALTLTGAKADHRLALPPAQVVALAAHVAAALGAPLPQPELPEEARRFADACAADLQAHRGAAVVLVGSWQPPEMHAMAHWMNAQLQAPVDHFALPAPPEGLAPAPLAELARALRADHTKLVVLLEVNPVYSAPADLDFARALERAPFSVHLGGFADETARRCTWHLPQAHVLESWGDYRAPDGTAAIAQPMVTPLYGGRSPAELLALLGGRLGTQALALVRETWSADKDPAGFEGWWRSALEAGVVPDSAAPRVSPPAPSLPALPAAPATAQPVLLLRPDPSIWDGRYAPNAWLQECPKPITSQVWGNAAVMAPATAAAHGLTQGEVVRLRRGERMIEAPVITEPAMAPGVVQLTLGLGRAEAGAIGSGIGVNGYALRTTEALWMAPDLAMEGAGRRAPPLLAQPQVRLEGEERDLFRTTTLDRLGEIGPAVFDPPTLYPRVLPDDTHEWAMVIDTTLCIGCNACVLACQAENNVPVVGPREFARGRDMHWLRIDTYRVKGQDAPGFQPVPCMHCEKAPCEPVCPVMASVHDAEGLNVQVYNRCIGTRFCQANCPYKVRRFNFFGYADGQTYENLGEPSVLAQRNPEVTVRARGVMEKCTYCVQRISAARRDAKKADRPIAEGEVRTACQQACPTTAIRFGDLRRADAEVNGLRRQPHHYALLGHLGTRPRTTYLAEVTDPNPALRARQS